MDWCSIIRRGSYSSRFLANHRTDKRIVSGSDHYSGDREENLFWWEGQGSIKCDAVALNLGVERGTRLFLFKTKEFYEGSVIDTLEKALILFDITNDRGLIPKIVNYPLLIDETLWRMYNSAIPNENEIIPTITPPVLNFDELVKKGLVVDETKQINLPLKT